MAAARLSQCAAIVQALAESQPGDVVSVHAVDCGTMRARVGMPTVEVEALCTCTPLTVTVGPKA